MKKKRKKINKKKIKRSNLRKSQKTMPKIKKDTIKKLPQTHSLKIFKYEGSENYYCSFYVGQVYTRNGNKEQSLKVKNSKEVNKKEDSAHWHLSSNL